MVDLTVTGRIVKVVAEEKRNHRNEQITTLTLHGTRCPVMFDVE